MENKSKHTPGPNDRTIQAAPNDQFFVVLDRNGNFVAKTFSQLEAYRIAAAPDLLEAARVALADMEKSGSAHYYHKDLPAEKLRAAIAKAEGRE